MTMAAYTGPVEATLRPDTDVAFNFLTWWFRGCAYGRVEIGWMDPAGRGLIHFRKFDLADLADAALAAAEANSVPGQSVYVRASTVSTPDGVNTADVHFVQSPGVWADLDTPEHLARAKTVETLVRPTASVITGRTPHLRTQLFFRAEQPIGDALTVRSLNTRIHALYGGDPAVVNPTRLMRLPGTVAWPWKPNRVPELTGFAQPSDGRPEAYPLPMLMAQLPQEATPAATDVPIASTSLTTASKLLHAIQAGENWHVNMVRLVAHWIGRGWSNVEILTAAETFTLPGYTAAQTRAEVVKAIEGGRRKWARPDIEVDVENANERASHFSAQVYDPWEALIAPEFPIEALPDVLRRFVEGRSRVIGCDPAALAWSCISAVSAAIHGQTRLQMKRQDTWKVPPAIWVALVGPSSAKKTPAINAAWNPLERFQARLLGPAMQKRDAWEALSKKEKETATEPPHPLRYVSNGATIESLQVLLGRQDRGIGVLHDELAGLIEGMDRYSGGKGSGDRAFYLQAYNGGSFVVDRVGRGTTSVENLLIAICGGIQPAKLAQFRDLTDDGLWQRFLPIIVRAPEMGTDEAPGAESEAYAALLESLASAHAPSIVQLSEAAHEVRFKVEQDAFEMERNEPLGGRFASFCGKIPGLFGRLCLVLSQVEGIPFSVSGATARSARILINSAVLHAGRLAIGMGGDGDADSTQAIAGYILAKRKERVLASELSRDVRACRKQPVNVVQRLVSPLVAGGWLNPEKEHGGNTSWAVNPVVHDAFHNRALQETARRVMARERFATDGHEDGED